MSSSPQLFWYAHRLKAMNPKEVLHRMKERRLHKQDPHFAERLEEIDVGEAAPQLPMLPHVSSVPWDLRVALKTDTAELLRGQWQLFGWRSADVGSPPCWHRDASTGVVISPDELSWKMNHRKLSDDADARTIWEINRWSQMTRVAMHAWVDKDLAAIDVAQGWIDDWCDRNPPGYGVNWVSSLEVALRLVNFTWFDALVTATGNETIIARQRHLTRRVLPAHALWVRRYLSVGSSANNHRLGELSGLIHAVRRWPTLERYVGTANDLWDMLAECIMTQFAEDGGNKEQALHYHLFSFELAWHARRLMVVHRADVTDRLRAAAEYFVRMLHPAEAWDFGDSDEGEVIPMTANRATASSEWQNWLAGMNDKSSLGFWLGTSPLRGLSFDEPWWTAPQSGMAVGESAGWLIRVDGSPLGFGKLAAHGHCDAMHVSLWDGMTAVVIDPGTGGYYGLDERRAELTSWEAHNGPIPLEGFTSPKRIGTFLWTSHHPKPVLKVVDARTTEVGLKHQGHQLKRTIHCRDDGLIRISDEEIAKKEIIVRWCLAPECKVQQQDENRWLISRNAQRWTLTLAGEGVVSSTLENSSASRRYGEMEPTHRIVVRGQGSIVSEWARFTVSSSL